MQIFKFGLLKYIFVLLLILLTENNFLFAQSGMLAYNDGITNAYLSSGLAITIQGGFTSQHHTNDGQIDNEGTINISGDFNNNNTSSQAFLTPAGLVNLNGTT